MKSQEQLFQEVQSLSAEILGLGAFIQNDFSAMLKDGTTTKEDISKGRHDFNDRADEAAVKLLDLCEDIENCLLSYIKE